MALLSLTMLNFSLVEFFGEIFSLCLNFFSKDGTWHIASRLILTFFKSYSKKRIETFEHGQNGRIGPCIAAG